MNYEELVCQMLVDADENRSPERFTQLLRALSFGIAQISVNAGTMDGQEALLNKLFASIRAEARATLMEANGMSGEEFLKHVYQPVKPND